MSHVHMQMAHDINGTYNKTKKLMRMLVMKSRPKAISYGGSGHGTGISRQNRARKAIKAFVVIISITAILAYFTVNGMNKTSASATVTRKQYRHHNPCRHVTPEPEIIMQEKFDSDDYFFPDSYKERICASPKMSGSKDEQDGEGLQMCFMDPKKGKHSCITRYKKFEVVRMPYPGNLTSKYWTLETIRVAVACVCTGTEVVKTYGP